MLVVTKVFGALSRAVAPRLRLPALRKLLTRRDAVARNGATRIRRSTATDLQNGRSGDRDRHRRRIPTGRIAGQRQHLGARAVTEDVVGGEARDRRVLTLGAQRGVVDRNRDVDREGGLGRRDRGAGNEAVVQVDLCVDVCDAFRVPTGIDRRECDLAVLSVTWTPRRNLVVVLSALVLLAYPE